ncbi:MAG: hypothetical protein QOE11_3019 [Solirubrobacteraceae bacterium]|jgi:hypothetical protein|nr:hypothetical protein [Solirubrobacteraceae bacterium]
MPSVRRLLFLTLLLSLLIAAPASAGRTQGLTFEAPRDLMNPATRPAALAEMDSLGVASLRVILTWAAVAPSPDAATRPAFEPTDPDAYDWGEYDALLAAAKERNWPVLLTISGPVPKWATKDHLDKLTRPSSTAFAAFVTAVGRHYGDQVDTWAIWNEPNQPQFLRPQFGHGGRAISPLIYRSLYLAGVRGLRKAGQGNDRILLGETSPRGTGRVVAPLAFLRGALCLDKKYKRRPKCGPLPASGYAHHAYTTRQGPFFKPANPDDVTIGVLSRLTTALDRARAAGALTAKLPVYLTEFGIQSTPDTQSGVSLAKQVEYRAIAERIAYDNPRVVAFSQYLLRDSDPTGPKQYGGFESGLRFADGRPKPSLPAFRLPLAVRRTGSKVSIWGLVRPAAPAALGGITPAAGPGVGPTTVTIVYADRGSSTFKPLKTVTTDAKGYFTLSSAFKAGRRWNVRWTSFAGTPVESYQR